MKLSTPIHLVPRPPPRTQTRGGAVTPFQQLTRAHPSLRYAGFP
jgi:hypothetical protein